MDLLHIRKRKCLNKKLQDLRIPEVTGAESYICHHF